MATIRITGKLIMPNGEPAQFREVLFKRMSPDVSPTPGGGVVVDTIRAWTDINANLDAKLVPGGYVGEVADARGRINYNFAFTITGEEPGGVVYLQDLLAAASFGDPVPYWFSEIAGAAAVVRPLVDAAEGYAASAELSAASARESARQIQPYPDRGAVVAAIPSVPAAVHVLSWKTQAGVVSVMRQEGESLPGMPGWAAAGVKNPYHYGAAGDGVADDTSALRALFANGGEIEIPVGTFMKNDLPGSQIVMASNTRVVGRGGIIYHHDTPENSEVTGRAFYASDKENITFEGVNFLGSLFVYDSSTNAKQMVAGVRNTNIVFRGCSFRGVRFMAISMGGTNGGGCFGCAFEFIGRDAARFPHSGNIQIIGNRFYNVSDDSVALHSRDTDYVGAVSMPVGNIVSGNIFEAAQGIRALGSKGIVVTNNVFKRATYHAVHIEQGWSSTEGNTAPFSIIVSGNVILDTIVMQSGASNPPGVITIIAGARTKGVLTYQPGVVTTPLPYLYENDVDESGKVSVGGQDITVSGNTISRTLKNVAKYSDWGFGEYFDHRNTGSFWSDPPITDASFPSHGVAIGGPVASVSIDGNRISGLSVGKNSILIQANGDANVIDFHDFTIRGNTFHDCPGNGVSAAFTGSGAATKSLVVQGNIFDLDPYRRSPSHNADNTWNTQGDVRGVVMLAGGHLEATGNTFRNVAQAVSLGAAASIYHSNTIWSQPVAAGNNALNKGVRVVDQNQINVIYDADPASSSYGQVITIPSTAANSQPATGTYVQGHIVRKTQLQIAGSSGSMYVITGWARITTGSGNVEKVDWTELRSFTGS